MYAHPKRLRVYNCAVRYVSSSNPAELKRSACLLSLVRHVNSLLNKIGMDILNTRNALHDWIQHIKNEYFVHFIYTCSEYRGKGAAPWFDPFPPARLPIWNMGHGPVVHHVPMPI